MAFAGYFAGDFFAFPQLSSAPGLHVHVRDFSRQRLWLRPGTFHELLLCGRRRLHCPPLVHRRLLPFQQLRKPPAKCLKPSAQEVDVVEAAFGEQVGGFGCFAFVVDVDDNQVVGDVFLALRREVRRRRFREEPCRG